MAPSFADIFKSNCFQNGILHLELPDAEVDHVLDRAAGEPVYSLAVSLEDLTIQDAEGWRREFEVDDFRSQCLPEGLDDIALTLKHEREIARFEAATIGMEQAPSDGL